MTNDGILSILSKDLISYAWAIQDLTRWPERCKVFTPQPDLFSPAKEGDGFAFLLISGHPACRECPAVILGGDPRFAEPLLKHLPREPYVIRETGGAFQTLLARALPKHTIYPEQQMIVTRETFKPTHKGSARRLTPDDAQLLANYFNNPGGAFGMKMWLANAMVFADFAGDKIAAIGSTIATLPEVTVLASIETREEYRRKGHGAEVTFALTAAALKQSPTVALTVVNANAPAIGLYTKLGYQRRCDRLWVDGGANFRP